MGWWLGVKQNVARCEMVTSGILYCFFEEEGQGTSVVSSTGVAVCSGAAACCPRSVSWELRLVGWCWVAVRADSSGCAGETEEGLKAEAVFGPASEALPEHLGSPSARKTW